MEAASPSRVQGNGSAQKLRLIQGHPGQPQLQVEVVQSGAPGLSRETVVVPDEVISGVIAGVAEFCDEVWLIRVVVVESEDGVCEAVVLSPSFDVPVDEGESDGELLVELSNRVLLATTCETSHIVLTTLSICAAEGSAEQLCQP
jgi:hypothetical protein